MNNTKSWTPFIMSALLVSAIILAVVTFLRQKSNSITNTNNILMPFSAEIKPGETAVFLKNSLGGPQIDCSANGGKINIVGSWVEVVDPFGSCTGNSADVLNLSCGLKSKNVHCNVDSDCGPGMSCAGGVCNPSKCELTSLIDPKDGLPGHFDPTKCSCGGNYCPIQPGTACDPSNSASCNDNGSVMFCNPATKTCEVNPGQNCMAPDQYTGKVCAIYPLCSKVDTSLAGNTKNVINNTCSPTSKNLCRPRDNSAYLAAKCDGQTTCNVLFNPSDPNSGFGPAPCRIKNTDVTSLPITPGQGGNYSQGYYVHGLYTCIIPQ